MPEACSRRPIAVLFADGRRNDPLALWAKASAKPLVRLVNRPMVHWALDALVARDLFDHIEIASQNKARLEAELGPLLPEGAPVAFCDSAAGVVETIATLVAEADGPLLVTTSDHVLLTPETVCAFVAAARGADLAAGLVERRTLEAVFPGRHRTWLRSRDGVFASADLFWIGSARALPLIELWYGLERDRRPGWTARRCLGFLTLVGIRLNLLRLERLFARIGGRFGIELRPIVLNTAEACLAVANVADLRLAEQILLERHIARAPPIDRTAE